MGRIDTVPSPNMMHFSHPHELELWNSNFQPQQSLVNVTNVSCSACQLAPSENMYICKHCNFSLHSPCAQFPQFITHPAHRNHTLALLPVAAYPGGFFNCDACNRQGNGFSYHCSSCEYDLHVLCAAKPLKFTHQFHSCELELTFTNPYSNTKGFSCDICRKFGYKQWLYRCAACEFDVHFDCTITSPKPAVAPHAGRNQTLLHDHNQSSFPSESGTQWEQSHILQQHHQSGAIPTACHGQFQTAAMGVLPDVLMHGSSSGEMGNFEFLQQPINRTSGMMNYVNQGVAGGGAQHVGQSLVQSVIGASEWSLLCGFDSQNM